MKQTIQQCPYTGLKLWDVVKNPDLSIKGHKPFCESGNSTGTITEFLEYKEMPGVMFATVKFKDYECGFKTTFIVNPTVQA